MNRTPTIDDFVPQPPRWDLDWHGLRRAFPWVERMHSCPQDPRHHAEGDVGTHTRMMCEALIASPRYQSLPEAERRVLFAAALLHDVAKPDVSVVHPDGGVSSHGHSGRGSVDARIMLWRAGWSFPERETVARLIAVHQLPFFAIDRPDPTALARKLSLEVRIDLLCMLAEADGSGRRTVPAGERQRTLDQVELFRLQAEEDGCLDHPYAFADDRTRFLYCRDVIGGGIPNRPADHPTHGYQDTPGVFDVTVMCGLPGSGKDTWLARNRPDLEVIGFDMARTAAGVRHEDDQGTVVQTVMKLAKERLNPKARRRFAWSATNTSLLLRRKCLGLLADYGARIEVVYVEEAEDVIRRRNRERPDATCVPDKAIDAMLLRWEPPTAPECHRIQYVVGGRTVTDPSTWRTPMA